MKLNPRERLKPIPAVEALSTVEAEDPAVEVKRLIDSCRGEVVDWATRHRGAYTYMTFGRWAVELFPDLESEFGLRPSDWDVYKKELDKIRFSAGNGQYLVGAVQWFPERRGDIQEHYARAIQNLTNRNLRKGWTTFSADQQLSYIVPDPKYTNSLRENFQLALEETLVDADPMYAKLVNAGKILVSFPERRLEVQEYFTARLPRIRQEVVRMKQDWSTHDLPGFLHGLKIIFAEQVTADEYGRLTFKMGDTTRAGQREELPSRPIF